MNLIKNFLTLIFMTFFGLVSSNQLVELNPEQASMNTIVPIFRTIMGIVKKQQEEINQLKSIIASQ